MDDQGPNWDPNWGPNGAFPPRGAGRFGVHTINKDQQCRTSKKDGKLLHIVFFNKQSFPRCPETPRDYCVCLLLSPCRTEVPILSTNQCTVCVAREIASTLSGSQYPNGGVLRESTAQCGSVRVPTPCEVILKVCR